MSAVVLPPWQPDSGPHDAVRITPPRQPGSVRRTTSLDIPWPDYAKGEATIVARGRDLVTATDGTTSDRGQIEVVVRVDIAMGRVLEITGDEDLAPLLGATMRSGFGRHLAEHFPAEARERSLRFSLLDDLPGAFLVSGYSMVRNGMMTQDAASGPQRAAHQADVCIGWASGSPVHVLLRDRGATAIPYGPVAPDIAEDDPAGWHLLARLEERAVRRRRQLDVQRNGDGGLEVQSHFRDSYADDDHEMVMHEYLVRATIDASQRVAALEVEARVLPWADCPGAVASAQALVGSSLEDVHSRVRASLAGTVGCTHLSSTLRALADVGSLADEI